MGQFATCANGYYSGQERSIAGQIDLRVRRSGTGAMAASSVVRPLYTKTHGCRTAVRGVARIHKQVRVKDDTAANYAGFTHGGCPDGFCSNFAAGRQCKVCPSSAFTDYNADVTVCPVAGSGEGKCNLRRGR